MAPSTEKSSFERQWLKGGLLAGLVLILALPVLATVVIELFVDGEEVSAWLEPKLSAAMNRTVTVGDASVVLVPRPGVRLTDVRVGGGGTSEVPSIVTVEDVHLQAAFLPLLTGRVHTRQLRLRGLDVHLAVDDGGVSNFGDLVPESSLVEIPRNGPVHFGIEHVEIDDASLTWFDGPRQRSLALSGASGRLELGGRSDGRWVAYLDADADSLLMRVPALADDIVRTDAPSIELTALGDGSFDWIEIEEGLLTHWGETLAIRGRVEALSDVDPRVDLRLENRALDLSPFVRLVPPDVRARVVPALEGKVDLRLALRGSLRQDNSPNLSGSVGLVSAGLRLGGDPVLTDVSGRLGVRPTTLALDSIMGTFADGPFLVDGVVERLSSQVTLNVVASPKLETFERLGLAPFGSKLAGSADLRAAVEGPYRVLDSLRIDGAVRASGVQMEHAQVGVPVYAPSLTLDIDDSVIRWADVEILVGTEPTTTSGRLASWLPPVVTGEGVPSVEAALRGETLDMGAVATPPELPSEVTYSRIALAHLGGREIDGRRPDELVELAEYRRPTSLPLRGRVDVQLGRLLYGSHDLADVSVRLVLADSALYVRDAEFAAWDGAFAADLMVGVGDRLDEPFELRLTATDAGALGMLLQTTPASESIAGRLDVDLSVDGSLDRSLMPVSASLRGGGTVRVREGAVTGTGLTLALADFLAEERWRSLPFDEWTTELVLEEGILQVMRSELRGDRAMATLSGAVGLGGAVDLAMALSIPASQLEAVSLRRTGVAQTVLDQLRASGSALDLGIRISGTLEGPTLEPDALAAAEQIASTPR
ncbi:MAG: AsmA family protein [Gemmatimonadetes bacterium]|nr:AsmA family protein [Gemmatimonadota bacterium]